MNETQKEIIKFIIDSVDVHNKLRNHLSVRCPECGDSQNNLNHSHCNITLDKPILLYRCVRCDWSGIVDSDFLRSIGVYNDKAITLAYKNKLDARDKLKKEFKDLYGSYKIVQKVPKIPISNTDIAKYNLEYLSNRLDFDITPELAAKQFKIITDFRELFKANKWIKKKNF